jgi:hypothetical protein
MEFLKRAAAALKTGLHTLSPNCREASRLQSDALDQPLSLPRRFGLRLHLLICKWCRRYGKQIRFLRQAVHEHPDELSEAVPRSLSPEARERLKQTLRDDLK